MRDAMTLIDDESSAPARDRQQLWLALVFNVLIGNCDAHGKNYSLLYDSPAPSLAPFYDLLSTAAYAELDQATGDVDRRRGRAGGGRTVRPGSSSPAKSALPLASWSSACNRS